MTNPMEDPAAEYLRHRENHDIYAKRGLALKAVAMPLLIAGLIFGFIAANKAILLMITAVSASLGLLEMVWRSFGRFHRYQMNRDGGPSGAQTEEREADWVRRPAWLRFLLGPYANLIYIVPIAIGLVGLLLSSAPDMTERQAGPPACCCTECPVRETISGSASTAVADSTKKLEPPPSGPVDGPAPPPPVKGERTAGINWLVPAIAAVVAGLAALLLVRVQSKAGSEQDSRSSAHIYGKHMSIPMAAVTALTAFGVAWTSIGAKDSLGLWCLPLLMIPLVLMIPPIIPAERRKLSWILAVSLVLAIIAASAYLMIDWPLPNDFSQLRTYLGTTARKFMPNDLRDGVSIAVVYLAYLAALFGALLSTRAPGKEAQKRRSAEGGSP